MGAALWGAVQAAGPDVTARTTSSYLEPPPFLGGLVLISCHIFTRGSLFFQMSSWPYVMYHLGKEKQRTFK